MNKYTAVFGYLIAVNFEALVIIMALFKVIPWLNEQNYIQFNWGYILIPIGSTVVLKDYYNVIKKIMKY